MTLASLRISLAWALSVAALLGAYIGGYPLAYLLMALTLLIAVSLAPPRRQKISAAGWCFVLAWGLLALAFAASSKGPANLTYLLNFIMFVLALPLLVGLDRQAAASNTQRIANLALIGVAIAAGVAAFQVVVLKYGRASGWGSDEIWSATAALAIGWMALIGRVQVKGRRGLIYLAGPFLGVVVVLLSGSRGPMLALPLLFAASFLTAFRFWRDLLALGAAIATLVFIWPGRDRFFSLGLLGRELANGDAITDSSGAIRKLLLDGGLYAFWKSPWLGYGWGRFAEVTGRTDWVTRPDSFHLHSDPLDFAVGAGIVGLVAYALIIAAPIMGAWLDQKDSQSMARRLGAAILAAAYLGCGLTNGLFGFEFHTTLYVCLTAILVAFCRDRPLGRSL